MSRAKLVGAGVVVVALVVWSIQSFVVDADSTTPTTPPSAAAVPAGTGADVRVPAPVAVGEVSGVPVGYPRTGAGAVTAAVNWVASFPRLMRLNPLSLQNTLIDLMSEAGASTGVDEAVEDYFVLFEELGPEFRDRVWLESPLQTSVVAHTDDSATVAVWSVLVTGGGPTNETVVSIWRTHHIEVVWEHDDWKIETVQVSEGPTPTSADMALPASPDEFVEVDSWTPAVFADTTTNTDDDED